MVKISRPKIKNVCMRHHLFEKMDRMRQSRVIWVSAPAGAGKTTLVGSYLDYGKIPSLWFQLDEGDSDIATFFYYLGLAVEKTGFASNGSLPLLTPEYLQGIPAFTRRYFTKLYERLKSPSLLVFDNYQEVPSESPLHEVMGTGFSLLPEGVNAVVMSRGSFPDVMINLKVRKELEILDWEEIRLSPDEAREIIRLRTGEDNSEETIQHLVSLSRGWTAGLVLMSENAKLAGGKPCMQQEHSFDEVFTYFAQEVFKHLDVKTREFFLKTSIMPKMTASMASGLTGDPHAASILRKMDRDNYFILSDAASDPIYEYHPLYRDFLLSRTGSYFQPAELTTLRRCAAAILEKTGMTEPAVALLADCEDWPGMAGLIVSHAPSMLKQGRYSPLRQWLETLPSRYLEADPMLLYFKGMSILLFSPSRAASYFERAFTGFREAGDRRCAIIAASGAVSATAFGLEDFTPMDRWYEVLNDLTAGIAQFSDEELEASAVSAIITALTYRDIYWAEAQAWFERALNLPETPETAGAKAQAVLGLLWYRLLDKNTGDALAPLRMLQRLSRLHGEQQPLISITACFAEAMCSAMKGGHAESMQSIQKGLTISNNTGVHVMDPWLYTYTALICLDSMDIEGARAWFVVMAPLVEKWPNWPQAHYHFQAIRAALIRRDFQQACWHAEQTITITEKTGNLFTLAESRLLYSQVLHKAGRLAEAEHCLELCLTYVRQTGNQFLATATLLCAAQYAFDDGDEERGSDLLRQSLSSAREGGFFYTWQDDPAETVRMCAKALEMGIETEHAREVIRRRGLVPAEPPIHIEEWPWPVKVYTLGRFDIVLNDAPPQHSQKAQVAPLRLLKALIALGGSRIADKRVADLFWPETDGDLAQHTLKMTIHRLRRLLGRPEAIQVSGGRITLDKRHIWVDVWAFERMSDMGEVLWEKGETGAARECAEKTLALYRGAFLGGETEEPWIASIAGRLQAKFLRAASRFGFHLEETEAWESAVVHYERCLEVDDSSEDLYRSLIICHSRLGKTSEALSAYQRCCGALAAHFGIKPAKETQDLRAIILNQ